MSEEDITMAKHGKEAMSAILGDMVVIRYDQEHRSYHVNPDGTGTKALVPDVEQAVIDALHFEVNARRFPKPDDWLTRSQIPIAYQGF